MKKISVHFLNSSKKTCISINREDVYTSLFLGFLFSCFAFILLYTSHDSFLRADMNLTIIPTDGELGRAFRTGDFSFTLLLLYGMYLIRLTAVASGVIYMIMNIYAGITYITGTATGDKEAETGTNALINAFVGFAVVIFSWIIVDIIIAFFTTS